MVMNPYIESHVAVKNYQSCRWKHINFKISFNFNDKNTSIL